MTGTRSFPCHWNIKMEINLLWKFTFRWINIFRIEWVYRSATEGFCVARPVCSYPKPAVMLCICGAPSGSCSQISCNEAPSLVTAAELQTLVWCACLVLQHMQLLVTVKQAAVRKIGWHSSWRKNRNKTERPGRICGLKVIWCYFVLTIGLNKMKCISKHKLKIPWECEHRYI